MFPSYRFPATIACLTSCLPALPRPHNQALPRALVLIIPRSPRPSSPDSCHTAPVPSRNLRFLAPAFPSTTCQPGQSSLYPFRHLVSPLTLSIAYPTIRPAAITLSRLLAFLSLLFPRPVSRVSLRPASKLRLKPPRLYPTRDSRP